MLHLISVCPFRSPEIRSAVGGYHVPSPIVPGGSGIYFGLAAIGEAAAFVYTEPTTGWVNTTQCAILDTGGYQDAFSVAIGGNTVVIGDSYATGGPGAGEAYAFTEPSSGWTNMTPTAELNPADGAVNDYFGGSVAVSGNEVVVGAWGAKEREGEAYVFGTSAVTPPAIISSAVKSANVGQKYAYQVKTNAGVSEKITFSLGSAPAGMSVNATTGLVSWVPTTLQTGSDSVTVLARDQLGNLTQQTFSISVSGIAIPYNPFAPTTRGLIIVGPVLPASVVGTKSGPTLLSLNNSAVNQLLASSNANGWL